MLLYNSNLRESKCDTIKTNVRQVILICSFKVKIWSLKIVCLIIICMFSETSLMTRTSCIFITLGISSCPEVIPKVTNIHPIVNRQCHSISTHQIENWNQTDPNNKSDNTTRRDISHIHVIRVIFCSCVIDWDYSSGKKTVHWCPLTTIWDLKSQKWSQMWMERFFNPEYTTCFAGWGGPEMSKW